MRLLFAEDERDLNDIVCQKLRKEGYTVDACFDGAEALAFLAVADCDAVILDAGDGRLCGFEAAAC